MSLAIQTYLREGGTFADLLARYGITAKRHRAHPSLCLFKYNQLASPFGEQIVRECRGIVLDESREWTVVSRAFDKFFNLGEPLASEIDWSTARVCEKVDGSLITAYEHDGRWHCATTGMADAGGDIYGLLSGGEWEPRGVRGPAPATFADYFWQTARLYSDLFDRAPALPHLCFCFELTGPLNRIVVPHAEPRVTLLGARYRESGDEVSAEMAGYMLDRAFPVVREFPLSTAAGIAASFASISPLAQEGYVVVDAAFRRVKVKHPGYVALHHAKDGLSQRAFVEIARTGETPEVIAAFPELRPMLDETRERLDALVVQVEQDYSGIRDIAVQKDFAARALKTKCSAALFAVRAKKAESVRDYFVRAQIDQVMRLLGYREEKAA